MAGALFPLSGWGQMELDDAFVSPPFVLHETVVGKDGWGMTHPPSSPIYNDPDKAMLISTPLDGSGQETTVNLQTAIKNEQISNPGNRFKVEAQFAVAYNPRYQLGGGVYFQFAQASSTSPFHFGFFYGKGEEPGGLYYSGNAGRVIVLPLKKMQENEPYRFVVNVDMVSETFKVEVTGKTISNEAFQHRSEEVAFQTNYRPFKGETISFFIGNDRPTLVDAYVDYVKILRNETP